MDLRRQRDCEEWLAQHRPDAVFVAAATVGGIQANNTRPAEFIYDNLIIAANVVHAAHLAGVSKLMVLGSSCIYPKMAAQPITESALMTGALEPTNQWYAMAKLAAIRMAQAYRRQYGRDFIAVMPTSLYGPGDNYDAGSAHVIPALMVKCNQAKLRGDRTIPVWGSGRPRREFLYIDDLADALVFLMQRYSEEDHVNIGCGADVSIAELATLVANAVGFQGTFEYDRTKPDGTPRKLLDVSRMQAMGWQPTVALEDGLRRTYAAFLKLAAARPAPVPAE